jgi:hypothetical protein
MDSGFVNGEFERLFSARQLFSVEAAWTVITARIISQIIIVTGSKALIIARTPAMCFVVLLIFNLNERNF